MVDVDLALVDAAKLPYRFLQRLEEMKVRRVEITPDDDPWIVNGLAIAPGRVIVPPGCSPRTREALMRNNIELIELPYGSMQKNGGGIHCSTCPLVRDRVD
jgi:arginine deiminase